MKFIWMLLLISACILADCMFLPSTFITANEEESTAIVDVSDVVDITTATKVARYYVQGYSNTIPTWKNATINYIPLEYYGYNK